MTRLMSILIAAAVIVTTFAATANAYIEVRPTRVAQGENIEFVLRIHSLWPDANTHGVKVQFPEEVAVTSLTAPPLGWSQKPLGSRSEPEGVMFHGGIIPEGTHQDFTIIARTIAPGRTLWLAEQFYDNGVVERLTVDPTFQINDPDPYADGYAAVVEIIGNTPAPSEVAPSPAELDTPVAPAPEVIPDRGEDNTGVGMAERLGLVLLFFGLLAFVVVFVLSRTNAGFVPHQRSDTT